MAPNYHRRDQTGVSDTIDPLLTARESAALLRVSLPTFWRRVADGTIPRAIKLGCVSRWPQSEIVGVIAKAKLLRDGALS